MAAVAKPYKVWSSDRRLKKSVTASTLDEFITKVNKTIQDDTIMYFDVPLESSRRFQRYVTIQAKEKLGIAAIVGVKVVFEADGTEVDEDDYFQFLPFNTTLMVLRQSDDWHGPDDAQGKDEPDSMMGDDQVNERVKQLAGGLKRDITRLITFSNDDLQAMVDMSTANLAYLLGDTETYAKAVQEACQRHLDERQQTSDAMQLLKLYHKAREESPYLDDPKKPRLEQD